jgi:hypothetical protein
MRGPVEFGEQPAHFATERYGRGKVRWQKPFRVASRGVALRSRPLLGITAFQCIGQAWDRAPAGCPGSSPRSDEPPGRYRRPTGPTSRLPNLACGNPARRSDRRCRNTSRLADRRSAIETLGFRPAAAPTVQLRPELTGGAGIDLPLACTSTASGRISESTTNNSIAFTRFDALNSSAWDHGYWSRPLDGNVAPTLPSTVWSSLPAARLRGGFTRNTLVHR